MSPQLRHQPGAAAIEAAELGILHVAHRSHAAEDRRLAGAHLGQHGALVVVDQPADLLDEAAGREIGLDHLGRHVDPGKLLAGILGLGGVALEQRLAQLGELCPGEPAGDVVELAVQAVDEPPGPAPRLLQHVAGGVP